MNTPSPSTQRSHLLRKRVIGGGIVVGAVALVWFISGLGPGLGPGLGSGEGPGEGGGDSNGAQTSQSSDSGDSEDDGDNDAVATNGSEGEPPLKVLVSGAEYRIAWTNETEYVSAALEEIVDIARNMPGDADDLRVLIQYDRTGEVGAREDLKQALAGAGLNDAQFAEVDEPLVLP